MDQQGLVSIEVASSEDRIRTDLGAGLIIEVRDGGGHADLYRHGGHLKRVNLRDRIEKRLFLTETVEHGAKKSRVASALNISRQPVMCDRKVLVQMTVKHCSYRGVMKDTE